MSPSTINRNTSPKVLLDPQAKQPVRSWFSAGVGVAITPSEQGQSFFR